MYLRHILYTGFIVFFLTACGGGGGSGTDSTPDLKVTNSVMLKFNEIPTKNTEATLTLIANRLNDSDTISWTVSSVPTGVTLDLIISSNKKVVNFTPTIVGDYTLKVDISNSNFSYSRDISFTVKEIFSYNDNKVNPLGVIANQSWVYSASLDENSISNVVSKYNGFTKIGFDNTHGVLIQYDESNFNTTQNLEKLKLEFGIDKIYNRTIDNGVVSTGAIYPNDYEDFNNTDTAWHLRAVNMPEAWEYSTGSSDVMIGVCDAGYDTNNEDLEDKFSSILTTQEHHHGMAVTGSMVAIANNNVKIAGINWNSLVVASYMGPDHVEEVVNTTQDDKKVMVVNNSWGYTIPSTFNPSNASGANDRFEALQSVFASNRQLVENNEDKVFIWMAGNGVGNGLSDSGYYGVDGRYDNGALHYKDNVLNKVDNLLVVGAFKVDNKQTMLNKRLVYYSNFGESVDIVAPTDYDSLALDNGKYTIFTGTSAAAPIVTSVASLIYAINPDLTGAQVKNILINSATEFITHRVLSPRGDDNGVELLAHQIPVLNAKEALKMAEETILKNINVKSKILDITTPQLNLTYSSYNSKFKVISSTYTIFSSTTQNNYTSFNSGSSDINSSTIILDTNKRFHRIDANITLEFISTGDISYTTNSYLFAYSDITLKTVGTVNLEQIASVDINISKIGSSDINSITSDINGTIKIYLTQDDYRITASKVGYNSYVENIYITDNNSSILNIPLSLDNTHIGTISGVVRDSNDNPINEVMVRVSGGVQTNGYFASATTDENGYYSISNINLYDVNDTKIDNFEFLVSKNNYSNIQRDNVVVLDGISRSENFILYELDMSIFQNNIENNLSNWIIVNNIVDSNITWQMYDFNISMPQNRSLIGGNIISALDDDSNGSFSILLNGLNSWDKKAFWFGNVNTGDYTDGKIWTTKGGASNQIAESNLTTPTIVLPADSNVSLNFDTLWEVEGQNPANIADKMELYIIYDGQEVLLKQLNPTVDPTDTGLTYSQRLVKPYSSSGYNRKPIWVNETIDLKDYRGKAIKIKFRFNSSDTIANGFRGWIIDNIRFINN